MQPDPTLVADTRAWLVKASQDLRRASIFLAWRDLRFRRTHDLDAIGKQCVEVDPSLADLAERAEPLTAYAW